MTLLAAETCVTWQLRLQGRGIAGKATGTATAPCALQLTLCPLDFVKRHVHLVMTVM
jgi:hypothetical protein